jgi:hypothetical protein
MHSPITQFDRLIRMSGAKFAAIPTYGSYQDMITLMLDDFYVNSILACPPFKWQNCWTFVIEDPTDAQYAIYYRSMISKTNVLSFQNHYPSSDIPTKITPLRFAQFSVECLCGKTLTWPDTHTDFICPYCGRTISVEWPTYVPKTGQNHGT